MSKKIDLTGQRFGKLLVVSEAGRKRKEVQWLCKCDCGNTTLVSGYYLRKGHTKSCGCLVPEKTKEANTRHGMFGTRLYKTYYNMKNRCTNPNYYLFSHYGGRGITLCPEWDGSNGFQNFYSWAINAGYREGLSIDRINNDKGYSPDNCRWVTMKEQQNNRSNNRLITVENITMTLAEWADEVNICYGTLQRHVASGNIEEYIKEKLYGCT